MKLTSIVSATAPENYAIAPVGRVSNDLSSKYLALGNSRDTIKYVLISDKDCTSREVSAMSDISGVS